MNRLAAPTRGSDTAYPSVKDHGTPQGNLRAGERPQLESSVENKARLELRESKGGVRVSDRNCFRAFFLSDTEKFIVRYPMFGVRIK
jgi:hypothetical protein